ncbi:MAG: UxaA family hydrolase [Acetobacteraceae bacterium]
MSQNPADAVAVRTSDNVATLLRAVQQGETVGVACSGARFDIVAEQDIAFCHKIALTDLAPGDRIVKYGEAIGEATLRIGAGAWVHVHNMRSLRGRAPG